MRPKTLSKTLAAVEQIIFDLMATNNEFSSTAIARNALNQIHSKNTKNFSDYVARLEAAPENPFTLELKTLMNVVDKMDNPEEAVGAILEIERPVDEINILPQQFWGPDDTPENVYGVTDDAVLSPENYGEIKRYFESEIHFSELSPENQDLVDTLTLSDERFVEVYPELGEQGRMYELRQQLQTDLLNENIISRGEISQFAKNGKYFAARKDSFYSLDETYAQMDESSPQVADFAAEMTENEPLLGKITELSPEQGETIFSELVDAEGISSVRSNLALSNGGVLLNKSWLEGVLEKQAKGLLPGLIVVQPLLNAINAANPTVGSFINVGLSVSDFLLSLNSVIDPIGLAAATVGELFKELGVQNERAIENRDPTQWGGKKFGYVKQFKNGKQTWMPALLRSAEPVVSFGARGYKVTMETGGELIYTMDGEGKIAPHFTDPVRHSYNLDEAQLKNETYSGKEYIKRGDPIKEVYFLSDEEQRKAGDLTSDFFTPQEVDKTQLGPMEKHLYEMQSALNVAADWKNRNIATATGTDIDFWKEFEASRTLRDVAWDGNQSKYTYWLQANSERTGVTPENYKERRGDFLSHPENEYMINTVFFNTMKVLLKTQKALADESGLNKYSMTGNSGEKFYGEQANSVWQKDVKKDYGELSGFEQTDYTQLYIGEDVPTPRDSEELSGLLDGYANDLNLNETEKDFYAAKAMCRFWAGQIVENNGADELTNFVTNHDFYTKQTKLHKESRRLEVESDLTPSSLLEHTVYPWANKNEGIIPSEFIDGLSPEQRVKEDSIRQASSLFVQNFETEREILDGVKRLSREESIAKQQAAAEAPESPELEIKHNKYRSIPEGSYIKVGDEWKKVVENRSFSKRDGGSYSLITFEGGEEQKFDNADAYVAHRKSLPVVAAEPKAPEPEKQESKIIVEDDDIFFHHEGEKHNLKEVLQGNPELANDIMTLFGAKQEDLRDFLEDEHDLDLEGEITQKEVPFIAFDEEGNPALHGDAILHKELDLPANIAAVKSKEGIVHEVYLPN